MLFTFFRQVDRKRQKAMAILQWMERYSWRITNDCNALSCKSYLKHYKLGLLIATYRRGSKQYQLHVNWYCRFQCQLPKPSSLGWNSIDSSCQRHPNEKTIRQGLCLDNRHFRGDDSVMVAVYWQEKWTRSTFSFPKYVTTKKCTDEAFRGNDQTSFCVYCKLEQFSTWILVCKRHLSKYNVWPAPFFWAIVNNRWASIIYTGYDLIYLFVPIYPDSKQNFIHIGIQKMGSRVANSPVLFRGMVAVAVLCTWRKRRFLGPPGTDLRTTSGNSSGHHNWVTTAGWLIGITDGPSFFMLTSRKRRVRALQVAVRSRAGIRILDQSSAAGEIKKDTSRIWPPNIDLSTIEHARCGSVGQDIRI